MFVDGIRADSINRLSEGHYLTNLAQAISGPLNHIKTSFTSLLASLMKLLNVTSKQMVTWW